VWDEFDQETSESELAPVPSYHGSVPNRYAARAPGSTIAIRNNSLAHFSRADPSHFSQALKAWDGGYCWTTADPDDSWGDRVTGKG
jgi:hypothetical protein